MPQITGNAGDVMGVDSHGRGSVIATTMPESRYLNDLGRSFAAGFTVTPNGGASNFVYLGNTNDKCILVEEVNMHCINSDQIQVYITTAGVVGGTPQTLYAKKYAAPYKDTSYVASFQTAVALTIAGTAQNIELVGLDSAKKQVNFAPKSGILLPPGSALVLKSSTGGSSVSGTIHFSVLE